MDTKQQIINTALSLFNEFGYGAVSMRQIADEIGVDRRNITYHFNKEGLLKSMSDQMWEELSRYRGQKRDFPSFENLDKEVVLYNRLQNTYAFIFKDLNVINHPIIHQRFKDFCATMIADSQQAVAFAVEQGNMKPEPVAGAYHAICLAVWTISLSWLQLHALRDINNLNHIRKLIWSLIVPYFTEKGVCAFKSFFGNDFYENLGPSFNVKVNTLMF